MSDRSNPRPLRRAMLRSASLAALAALAMPATARAQAECGVPSDNRVTCPPDGNPYPNGVNYLDADDLVVATTPATVVTSGILVATGADGGVEQAGTVSSSADGRAGVRLTSGGAARYSGAGPVSTSGDFAPGVLASAAGPVAATVRDIATLGDGSAAVTATGASVSLLLDGQVSTRGTAATVGPAGIGGGFPGAGGGSGGTSNPGLDPGDLSGPSLITFFDFFIFDNAGIPQDDFDLFFQWEVTGGSVDLVGGVGPGVIGAPPNQPNGRFVDLGGSTGDPGRFETRLAQMVTPGTFNLSFDYRSTGGDPNSATASVGRFLTTTVASDQTTFRRFSGNFAVDAIDMVRIAFQGLESDTDDSGIGIDGVLFGPVLPIGPGGGGGGGAAGGTGSALGNLPAGTVLTADALIADATAGTASITNNGVVSAAGFGSRGIVATGTAGVTIAGTGRVATLGDLATGIEAASPGAVSVTQGSVATAGMMAPAIRATSTGSGVVAVDVGTVATQGFAARGIDAFAANGTVAVRAGGASTAGSNADAISAMNNGGGAVSVVAAGPIATSGGSSAGIRAMSADGRADVLATSVATAGAGSSGIVAVGATGASVATSGLVTATGAGAPAVLADTAGGTASIIAGNLVVTRGAGVTSLAARSRGGAATVTLNGLSSAGAGAVADAATAATITAAGLVTTSGAALSAAGDTAAVTVAGGATIAAGADAVTLAGSSASTLANAGTITSSGGLAVRASGGAAAIANSGTIGGRIQLGAGADRFANGGLFAVSGDSDFGAGADRLDNSGTVRALAASRSVRLAGLEALNNSGLVDLRNGSAGDALILPGSFTGSGGSMLALDVTLGAAPGADRLTVGTAAGSTAVTLVPTNAVTLTPGIVLVQGSAASSATAFTLAGGSGGSGLVGLDIVYDPATFAYALVGTPRASVFRTISAAEGVRNLWHTSAEAWSGHVRALRDDGALEGAAIWGQFYGALNSRDNARDFTTFGQTLRQSIGYRQDSFGFQGGVDLGRLDADGGFVFGATGGYLDSDLNFNGAGDRVSYDAYNAGVYASLRAGGGFFVNALGKYDWVDARIDAPAAGFAADPDGKAYGARLEAGLRLGGTRFFVEPVVGVAYVRSDLDDLTALDATGARIDLDSRDGLRGSAGLRLGSATTTASGNAVSVYASGEAAREFRGRDRIAFASGGTSVGFDGGRLGTYGRGTVGLNVAMPSGVTGFLEAHGEYGSRWKGGGGRAGLRVSF